MSEKKTYIFSYDVVESWKVWFEAESPEEAAKLYMQVTEGEINPSELPGFFEKNKGIESEFPYGLEDEAGNPIAAEANEVSND